MNNEIQQISARKRVYTKRDLAILALCAPLCFLYVKTFSAADKSLGRCLVCIMLLVLGEVYLRMSGRAMSADRKGIFFGISALVLSVGLVMTSNATVQIFSALYIFFAFVLRIYYAGGNGVGSVGDVGFAADVIRSAVIMPFGSFSGAFEAVAFVGRGKGKGIGRNILIALIGLAVAFVPALIVCVLLSYDSGFTEMTNSFFDLIFSDGFGILRDILFALFVLSFVFGAFYSSAHSRFTHILGSERCASVSNCISFAPTVLSVFAVLPFLVIYAVFFASQAEIYVSAFTGVLPDGFTYSEYARDGFFQLCAVSFINFLIIICTSVFSKDKKNVLLRICHFTLSVMTLALLATAASKMIIYVGAYGLTELRILSSAFMVFLAVCFVLFIIKQFLPKVNTFAGTFVCAFLILALLSLGNADGICADYNAYRYASGTLAEYDISELAYGDSGIAALERLAEKYGDTDAEKLLREAAREERKKEIFSYTVPFFRSELILKKYK